MCSVPAMAHAETLREALTSAYLNNPTILSSLLNVKATAENIALAKAAQRPSIGASASVFRNAAMRARRCPAWVGQIPCQPSGAGLRRPSGPTGAASGWSARYSASCIVLNSAKTFTPGAFAFSPPTTSAVAPPEPIQTALIA